MEPDVVHAGAEVGDLQRGFDDALAAELVEPVVGGIRETKRRPGKDSSTVERRLAHRDSPFVEVVPGSVIEHRVAELSPRAVARVCELDHHREWVADRVFGVCDDLEAVWQQRHVVELPVTHDGHHQRDVEAERLTLPPHRTRRNLRLAQHLGKRP